MAVPASSAVDSGGLAAFSDGLAGCLVAAALVSAVMVHMGCASSRPRTSLLVLGYLAGHNLCHCVITTQFSVCFLLGMAGTMLVSRQLFRHINPDAREWLDTHVPSDSAELALGFADHEIYSLNEMLGLDTSDLKEMRISLGIQLRFIRAKQQASIYHPSDLLDHADAKKN